MRHIGRRRQSCLWLIVPACVLFSAASAQDEHRRERPGPASTADEASLRALAREFYAAYARKDLEGCARLWGAKSPDFAERRRATAKLFADHEKIEVKVVVTDVTQSATAS